MKAALFVLSLLGQPTIPISDRVPIFNVEALCRDVFADDKASGLTLAQDAGECVRPAGHFKFLRVWSVKFLHPRGRTRDC
ncbi:hypothetical protein ABIF66_001478 [Bradyrhizobium japonicum]